jgi:hypothetical protein
MRKALVTDEHETMMGGRMLEGMMRGRHMERMMTRVAHELAQGVFYRVKRGDDEVILHCPKHATQCLRHRSDRIAESDGPSC